MIGKTIEEIKNTEQRAANRIRQVREEECERTKKLAASLEYEWEKLNDELTGTKAEIFKKYEKEAEQEITVIKDKIRQNTENIKNTSAGKGSIISLIIKDLLKEKE